MSTGVLIDFLGALGDYVAERNELAKRRAESDEYSFDYFHSDEIARVERLYDRCEETFVEAVRSVRV